MVETGEKFKANEQEQETEQILSRRFELLLERVAPGKGEGAIIFKNLAEQYNSRERSYHTLAHMGQCLQELDIARDLAENADAIEMAIWFHDIVYDTERNDNEEKSAQSFMEQAGGLFSKKFDQKVCNLILVTKHQEAPTDLDSQIMADIDLSIFGQPEEKFDEYEVRIHEEYKRYSDEDFSTGRKQVLQSFLNRPRMYSTDFFRDRYEEQARINLKRSINRYSE